MSYKPVPEVRSLPALRDVQAALPLVPGSVDDCCRRLQERAGVPSRDSAQQWLPFLVALGLASERDGNYYRRRTDPDQRALAEAFQANVLAVPAVLDAIAAEPRSPGEAFEATRGLVPAWERNRNPDWESVWEARTERLLDWAVVLGLAEERDGRYVAHTR